MEWQFDVYTIGLIFTTLASLSIASIALQHRERSGAQALGLTMLSISIWSIAYIFEANAVTIPLKVIWSQIAYIGTVSCPVFLLIFTAQFTHRHRWLTRTNLALLWLIPVITLILAATNGRHGLIWSGFEFAAETRHIIIYHHGPWFWVFATFSYLELSAVVVLLLAAARRMRQLYRRQSLVILLAILPSTTINVMYVFTPDVFNSRDWTPVSFFFSAALLAWAFAEMQLLDLVPLAKDLVLDSIQDGIIVINANRLIIDANPAARELLASDSIIGQDILAAFSGVQGLSHPPDFGVLPFVDALPQAPARTHANNLSGEIQIAGTRSIEWRLSPIERRKTHVLGYLVILRDVTEQRSAEAALRTINATLEVKVNERTAAIRAQQEQSDAILGSVSDGIVMTDRDLVIRFINPAFATMTGYGYDEALGEPARAYVGDSVYQLLRETRVDGQAWQGETKAQLKNGQLREVELTISPVCDHTESIVGYVCTERDITRAKDLDRARKGILDNISHQLRTPVTTLKLYTHLLKQADLSERHHRSLEIIDDQILWLQNMIEEILEMTSLDSGQAIRMWNNVPVAVLMDQLVALYRARATEAKLSLSLIALPRVELIVQGDEARLVQALGQLVGNAIKFTPAGGHIALSVTESSVDNRRGVAIHVQDTGPGVPDDEQPRVFERFFRGRITDSGQIPGVGLGLNIAQTIVAAHNGRISLESSNRGTKVTVWLPAVSPVEGD